jgi:hypothetical protein
VIDGLGQWIEHRDFIWFLRTNLGRAIPDVILDKIRNLSFENGFDLPESFFAFVTPAFMGGMEAELFMLPLALEVDVVRGAFRLYANSDDIAKVKSAFLNKVRLTLKTALPHIPVYHGRPE